MSKFLDNVAAHSRSQDFPIYYRLNGAIYICNTCSFINQGCVFLKENIFAYEMSKNLSIDIDTKDDFHYAEFLMDKNLKTFPN
jgi:CMP-N-acetylneuraminic acid synthetase